MIKLIRSTVFRGVENRKFVQFNFSFLRNNREPNSNSQERESGIITLRGDQGGLRFHKVFFSITVSCLSLVTASLTAR